MRFAVFSIAGGGRRLALVEDETLVPIGELPSFEAFLALDERDRGAALARRGAPVSLAQATLHAPLKPRKNVFCVGRSYLGHAEEGARARGEALHLPAVPTIFTKAPTSIADPDRTLELAARLSQKWDWEAELAIVIGRRCKDVDESDALDAVFGYTCLNDVTARDRQRATTQWFIGKTLDDTCPIGPWIVDAAEVGDPQRLDVRARLNGATIQHANTRAMIFSIAAIVSYLSQGLTLEPGDVIATGTPEGVGFARTPPRFLADGDVMEVDIAKVGILRNRVRVA